MKLTGWRRIAGAMWRAPDDPQIFGTLEVDATALLAHLAHAREAGLHLTPTHLLGRALAYALHAVPDLNVRIVGSRLYSRPSVDIFFITAVGQGDLSGVKVVDADQKSAPEIARELGEKASALRRGKDPGFARTKRLMERLPHFMLRPLVRLFAWLAGTHALKLPALGLEASPFGSAMVSSVGMLGLPTGFSPLAWMYKVPILVLGGQIADKPVAIEGHVEVRKVMPVTATIDHRYADGWHIAALLAPFREYLADPARFEPALPAPLHVDGEQLPTH
ncbi:MAG: 2-oxo acid dehydrogenase subunit E2 [Deltaproteobacteria bacterium]|nr:2-oxo acid dehydrogenase subunit E2 [Deltaproteobacteria bacterium]